MAFTYSLILSIYNWMVDFIWLIFLDQITGLLPFVVVVVVVVVVCSLYFERRNNLEDKQPGWLVGEFITLIWLIY